MPRRFLSKAGKDAPFTCLPEIIGHRRPADDTQKVNTFTDQAITQSKQIHTPLQIDKKIIQMDNFSIYILFFPGLERPMENEVFSTGLYSNNGV